uniref:Cytochrome b n=1 Tax=Cepaea nemoralis TaxID=28835 RepID=CYB_CEPNE|nr:RecName: Full=Cytochrome b; AltName: Full=Complex III subunit 3; AltName: Full=Complex III subunit III; AltName: Full=Cytochrome b-c1 complex subunit 3; AltName: Full=Ubiquinol-cytochrome-c reductase complex cytochrome b subunit [Cepaea nemoralis]AAC09519.1 cytochrome b [Cepaea nemoralis]
MAPSLKKIVLWSFLALPSPVNISIWWNIGSLLGLLLAMQIMTGIFLSLHYTPMMVSTFSSMVHIMRDVPGGWLVRASHANGASMFFMLMYAHIGRGVYYQSYILQPRTWLVGGNDFLLSMATAFLGYVLPWGQMSYWGATVITNLLSAVPYLGDSLVTWVWGCFSVNQATLNRFYSFHFLLPFVILVFVLVHLLLLHDKGSSNPLGNMSHVSKVSFHPYFTWKILWVFVLLCFLLYVLLCYITLMYLRTPKTFIEANPMVTPTHIQPEWYFLFAYAILRAIPSKIGGVVALAMSVLYLYTFPLALYSSAAATAYNFIGQLLFWGYVSLFFLLTWLGACPVEEPYISLALPLTVMFFVVPGLYMISSSYIIRSFQFLLSLK